MERVFDTLGGYRELIDGAGRDRGGGRRDQRGAGRRERRASSGPSSCERFDIDARTIPGEEEARLTFRGATAGRSGLDGDDARARHRRRQHRARDRAARARARLPRVGGARLRRATPSATPLRPAHGTSSRRCARTPRRIIDAEVPARGARARDRRASPWRAPPTSFAAIDQELDPYDPERVDGYELDARRRRADPRRARRAAARASAARSPACTPTARPRSWPAGRSWSRRCAPSGSRR